MRVDILYVLVLCYAVANGQDSDWTPLEKSKWGEVSDSIDRALSDLAEEKGIQFTLVKLLEVMKKNLRNEPESTYEGEAEIKTKSDETIKCNYSLLANLDKKDHAIYFLLNCGEDDYTVIKE